MPAARSEHTATLLPNGKVLIAGGISQPVAAQGLSSAELYDPSTGSFSATGSMSVPRISHTATLLPDGRVLVTGGYAGFANQAFAGATGTAELYDPGAGTFTPTGRMLVPRFLHTATLLNNGKVLIAGGAGGGGPYSDLATAELYDPVTGFFTPTANMTTRRSQHLATLLVDGRVLIVPSGEADDHSAELYDPASGTFNRTTWTTDLGGYAVGATATLTTSGKVLVTLNPQECDAPGVAAGLYDSASDLFIAARDPIAEFCYPQATLLSDGSALIAGGRWFFGPIAQIYDPASGTFSRTGDMTTGRADYAATLLSDGTVLMSGGTSLQVPVASAELYHPAVMKPAARLLSLSANGDGAGAIQHASTYEIVSDQNPSKPGETVIIYCTGLLDDSVIPPRVAIGGRMAEVLWFGNTPGYPGLNQINVRVPAGVLQASTVSVRLDYLSRPSNEVTIAVR
jgi:Galactose oxidase, central domain